MSADPRTVRQRLVPEIGEEGQARIVGATALVATTGVAGEVEARYLAGAGFGLIRTSSNAASRAALETNPRAAIATDVAPHPLPEPSLCEALAALDMDAAALAVAQGSARALRQVRVAARVDVEPIAPVPGT